MVAETADSAHADVARELQRLLFGAAGVESFLADVARLAAGAVEHAPACGVTVGATGRVPMLGATSGAFAQVLDDIQYEIDDGPCLTCLRTATVVAVDDVAAEPRWPDFTRRALQAGARATLSVPLIVGDEAVGALNLYSRQAHALTEVDRVRAQQFAERAAGAVGLARRLAEREAEARHLETALSSRSTIDQALGVIMARTGVTDREAFGLLRTQSQHTNEKLRDVAARILREAVRRRTP